MNRLLYPVTGASKSVSLLFIHGIVSADVGSELVDGAVPQVFPYFFDPWACPVGDFVACFGVCPEVGGALYFFAPVEDVRCVHDVVSPGLFPSDEVFFDGEEGAHVR